MILVIGWFLILSIVMIVKIKTKKHSLILLKRKFEDYELGYVKFKKECCKSRKLEVD